MVDALSRPVFSAGGRDFTWADIIGAAKARGEWASLERELARRLTRERELAITDSLPGSAEITSAAAKFRHRMHLLSADELNEWLRDNDVTIVEWTNEMRRTLVEPADDESPINEATTERATWAHAVCSGKIGEYAKQLAEEVAVRLSEQSTLAGDDLAGLPAGRELFCLAHANDSALRTEVGNNQMNWIRMDLQRLIHADEMVVREAALCVRMDGRQLAEVARDAEARLDETSALLDDTEPALRPRLLASSSGELLGPLRIGDQHQLVLVVRRIPPSLDDPAVRKRATTTVVRRALATEVNRHVSWHWHEHH